MSPDRSTNSCHTQPVGSYREMGLLTPTSAHSSSARNTHRSTGRFVPPIITVTTPGHTTRNPYLMLPAAVSHAEKMDIILQDMRQKVQRLPILTEIWQEEFVLAQKVRGSVGECLSQRSVSQDIREVLRGGPTASPLPRSRIALQTGHTIPDFSLPNQSGRYVCALDLCRQGHWVVINFFRGYWCPVCCIAQLTLEKNCNKILQYATILSVSPEIEEGCVEMRGFSFAFDVLTDYDNVVGKQFGLVYTLTPGLIDAYARAGFDLHFQYHTECNQPVELPIPAVYIASPPNGVITWAYLNEDFKKRAPVEDIVAHLEKMHP
ncbi:Alkyl hydroperoxide reductase/ Thiol specific antioxidant/ Mal allergen [Pelomyxa schiedti]|nr:Alkyl hydroperoxide reductase/ Thiol specific antioxidant/ Mal allergen [Pelomyxa schiedti]